MPFFTLKQALKRRKSTSSNSDALNPAFISADAISVMFEKTYTYTLYIQQRIFALHSRYYCRWNYAMYKCRRNLSSNTSNTLLACILCSFCDPVETVTGAAADKWRARANKIIIAVLPRWHGGVAQFPIPCPRIVWLWSRSAFPSRLYYRSRIL